MTKKNLKWRLDKLPTSDEVRQLLEAKIISKEEARTILFNEQSDSDVRDLKREIKFLKKLVERLSDSDAIRVVIKEIEVPKYRTWDWYHPYHTWSSFGGSSVTYLNGSDTTTLTCNTGTADGVLTTTGFHQVEEIPFSDI